MRQDIELNGTTTECSAMVASLAVNGEATASGVTQFSHEACEGVELLKSYVPTPYALPHPDLQDLKSYFERPRLFARGTLPFGNRANETFANVNFSFLSTAFPQWTNRLSGAYGIRFKLCFRLQVAATAFHQGLYVMSFQYGPGSSALGSLNRSAYSGAITNLPHVRLDLSETTMVELSAPFLYPTEFFPVAGDSVYTGNIGTISLNSVLSGIAVTGLAPPSYELYVWLEDVELFGADNAATTVVTLQSPSIVSKELKSSKLISGSLDTVSRISSFVARHVPMLSSIAGPTAWAADIAAGVARYFGFAKPMIQDPVLRVSRFVSVGEGQVDLPFSGLTVGPFQSNTLAFDGVTGATEVDEMALSFITSQFSQICVGSVTTSNIHGTVVYASPTGPSNLWFRAPAGPPYCNKVFPRNSASLVSQSGNTFLPSSLMNIASYFRLWRGDFVYRFTFAKTKFHGGRYMVSYNPLTTYVPVTTSAPAVVDGPEVSGGRVQPYGYSQIMDLRDGNVFEFVVPYMQEAPYMNFLGTTGSITVTCIDPLQGSASVTPTVPFMVEVCGGENFELADYAGNYFVPTTFGSLYQQSGEITNSGLNSVVKAATTSASQHAIGERFTSVKQLIMIPSYSVSSVPATSTYSMYAPPWHYYSGYANTAAFASASPINVATTFTGCGYSAGSLAGMYAYARGSTDLHLYSNGVGSSASLRLTAEELPYEMGWGNTTRTDYQGRSNTSATPKVFAVGESPIHVRGPAYQSVVRVPVYYNRIQIYKRLFPDTSFSTNDVYYGHKVRLTAQNDGSGVANIIFSSSAGDDATLSTYLGPEVVVIPNSVSTQPLFPDWLNAGV